MNKIMQRKHAPMAIAYTIGSWLSAGAGSAGVDSVTDVASEGCVSKPSGFEGLVSM